MVILKADVVEQVGFRLLVAGVVRQVHPLGLQRTEEALHRRIDAPMSTETRGIRQVSQDQGIQFSDDVAFQAAVNLLSSSPFSRPSLHICLSAQVTTHPHQGDRPQDVVGGAIAASIQPMTNRLPDEAGNGLTPHRAASAASLRSRSGLSPATARRVAAVCGPIPNRLRRRLACCRVRH